MNRKENLREKMFSIIHSKVHELVTAVSICNYNMSIITYDCSYMSEDAAAVIKLRTHN